MTSPALLSLVLVLTISSSPSAPSNDDAIRYRPAAPPSAEARREMVRWSRAYRAAMAPMLEDWGKLVQSMRRGRLEELTSGCRAFQASLGRIDRRGLLEVRDPVIRLWLGRGLLLLDRAANRCRKDRVFELSFRLDQAGRVIRAIDQRLVRYR